MIASERRREILSELNQRGIVSIHDIAQKLGVSEITIRRDFLKLEEEGKLKRVLGGASTLDEEEAAEPTMSQRMFTYLDEKKVIGNCAADLVKDGECIFLDAGTTVLPLADILLGKNIKIVTYNTLLLGRSKVRSGRAEIILIGGVYRPSYDMNIGIIAQNTLKDFYFDIAFFSCSGIDVEKKAVFTTEDESLQMKKIAMENAGRKVLLADHHKLESRGFLRIGNTDDFDEIIIDRGKNQKYPANIRVLAMEGS